MSHQVGIAAIYGTLKPLLPLLLSDNVGRHRARTDSLTPGAMGVATLVRAIRAHGNAAEYMPLLIVLMLILAPLSASPSLPHILAASFTVGRLAQAFGMSRETHPNAIRFAGNLLTGLSYLPATGPRLFAALPPA